MDYIEAKEEVDPQLGDCQREFVLPCHEYQVRRIPRLKPLLELFHAVKVFVEVGRHLGEELLELLNCVNIARVSKLSAFRGVLHLFAGVVYEVA